MRYTAALLHSLSFSSKEQTDSLVVSPTERGQGNCINSTRAPSNVAGVLEEYGKERPSTSKAELMVLALVERTGHEYEIIKEKKQT